MDNSNNQETESLQGNVTNDNTVGETAKEGSQQSDARRATSGVRYGQRRPPGLRYRGRRRVPPFKENEIDWKNLKALRYFIGPDGAMRPRRRTGASGRMQRRVAQAIKRARHMALLPYTNEHGRLYKNGK